MKLIDLQVNGYMGVDFSSLDLNESDFFWACEKLIDQRQSFLPLTTIKITR